MLKITIIINYKCTLTLREENNFLSCSNQRQQGAITELYHYQQIYLRNITTTMESVSYSMVECKCLNHTHFL